MGMRFRKSIKLGKGFKINLSKSGIGYSLGTKGYRYTKTAKGRNRTTTSIPGTGISYVKESGKSKKRSNSQISKNNTNTTSNFRSVITMDKNYNKITIILLLFFFPAGLFLMWRKTNWNKVLKIIISIFFGIVFLFYLIVGLSTGTTDNNLDTDNTKPKTNISEISLNDSYKNGFEFELGNVVSSREAYVTVKYDGNFEIENLDFVSENPEIATIEFTKNSFDTYIYFKVTPVSKGETYAYIQTTDGNIKSDKINIVVKEKETTTTTTTTTKKVTTTKSQSSDITVYITNSGSKYHSGGCRTLKKSKIKTTLKKAKSQGYKPCGVCYPPQ